MPGVFVFAVSKYYVGDPEGTFEVEAIYKDYEAAFSGHEFFEDGTSDPDEDGYKYQVHVVDAVSVDPESEEAYVVAFCYCLEEETYFGVFKAFSEESEAEECKSVLEDYASEAGFSKYKHYVQKAHVVK